MASGTNTTAALVIGSGASLSVTGTGYVGGAYGTRNASLGSGAGGSFSSGADNTTVGNNAGLNITTGGTNTFIGSSAGQTTIGGSSNVAIGYAALFSNVSGSNNTTLGYEAGVTQAGANDSNNTFIGSTSGVVANGSASGNNTAVGAGSASALTTGVQNTIIGTSANCAATLSNQIALGYQATTTAANTAVIGNSSITDVYFGSTTPAANVHATTFTGALTGNAATVSTVSTSAWTSFGTASNVTGCGTCTAWNGTYITIGKITFINVFFTTGTVTGAATVTLPNTCTNNTVLSALMSSASSSVVLFCYAATTQVHLALDGSSSNFPNNVGIYFSGVYQNN
jgi:hypothetical protein